MTRRLVVEADGGSRGNPGPAGYGAVVRDAVSGEVLGEVAAAIGVATNNVAEYSGLIAGLEAAARIDSGAAVEVRLDSKLVVEQLSGRWKVKQEHLRPLVSQAAALLRGFPEVTLTWVPRERNRAADALANAAMDAAAAGREWTREERRAEVPEPEPEPAGPNRLSGWMDPADPPTTFLLLRHGQTSYNVGRRFSGVNDQQLTAVGRTQAAAAAARIATWGAPVEAVVSSDLTRAVATAEVAADVLGVPLEVEPGFRETSFGDWEGFTFAEVREKWPVELEAWLASDDVTPPGGESFAQTTRRVRAARDAVRAAHPGRTVLVVSHVTPIKQLVRLALAAPPVALYRLHVDQASLTEIDWYADGPAVMRRFNDTGHLQ